MAGSRQREPLAKVVPAEAESAKRERNVAVRERQRPEARDATRAAVTKPTPTAGRQATSQPDARRKPT